MTGRAPVLLLGDLLVDVVMPVQAYPPPGGDAMANDAILRPGGSAVNTACALARLGLPARLLGRTGRDVWGEFELSQLRAVGVDVSGVVQDPDAGTGLTFAPVMPNGERTLFSYRGANNRTSPEDIDPTWFRAAGFFHLSGFALLNAPQRDAAWKALRLARDSGIPASLDTGPGPVLEGRDEVLQALSQVDLCSLGREEAKLLTGAAEPEAAADCLLGYGLKMAAVKLGPRGCLLATPDEKLRVPGVRVDVVDTTGAGDAFCAGLIYARLAGLDLPAAGLLAVTMGGLAATVWGAGTALPGKAEVRQYLEASLSDGSLMDRRDAVHAVLETLE